MDELSKERIKRRDRWTCKACGVRFVDLEVYDFINLDTNEPDSITLCKKCFKTISNKDTGKLLTSLVRTNKVVLIGDCHGRFGNLDMVLSSEEPFDFFISVGDVGSLRDITPQNLHLIEKWRGKGFFVRGNHDNVQFFNQLDVSQEIRGIKVSGLNGILKSRTFLKDTHNNISFREVLYLSHLKDVDILVTHQPPTGLFNDAGEIALAELMNYLVPKIYVCGHTHRYKLKFYLQTFVISLPMIHRGYAVAYFQGRDLRNLEIVLKKGKKFIRV